MNIYQSWIKENNINVAGECYNISVKMVKEFPELHIVIGEVLTEFGWVNHCWVCDNNENIIDPTKSQFKYIKKYKTK